MVQWSGLNLITDKMELFSESQYALNTMTISHIMAVVYVHNGGQGQWGKHLEVSVLWRIGGVVAGVQHGHIHK